MFSGHTAVPFLFFLFFQEPRQRAIAGLGSLVMAVAVLLTKNHYSVDVLSAYLIGYAIFVFSDRIYRSHVHPLYLTARTIVHNQSKPSLAESLQRR